MNRPSWRATSNPARVSSFRWKDSVAGRRPCASAIWPTIDPCGTTSTRYRKMARRLSCASADKAINAACVSIFPILSNNNEVSRLSFGSPTTALPCGRAINGNSSVRVLLADDHTLVRAGIRRLIESQPDIEVVAEARNGDEGLEPPHV